MPDSLSYDIYRTLPDVLDKMIHAEQHKALASIIEHIDLPFCKELALVFKTVSTEEQPGLILCDFMIEVCADTADTLGTWISVTFLGFPPGSENMLIVRKPADH